MSAPSLLSRHLRSHLRLLISLSLLAGLIALAAGYLASRVRAAGNTYYVATNGSDNYNGTAPTFGGGTAGPFKTIQKCASVAVAGDTCLIEGGTYHETVTPANSGTATAAITYAPYNGQSVTVDGADPVTNWSASGTSTYIANVTLPTAVPQDSGFYANQLFIEGVMVPEARWPNTGEDLLYPTLATAGAGTTQGLIMDSNLPNINWVGATLHLWEVGDPWTSVTSTVTASAAGQISFSDPCYPINCAEQGTRYYVTGVPGALDAPGEWSYDGNAHQLTLMVSTYDNPSSRMIEAKQRLFAFDLSGLSYITIQNIALFAATVKTDGVSSYDTLNGLSVQYPTHFVTIPSNPPSGEYNGGGPWNPLIAHEENSGIYLWGSYNTLENSTIAYSAGSGVSLNGSHNTVTNNLIHDVDYIANYAAGVAYNGDNVTITHNTMYNSGRSSITPDPSSTTLLPNIPNVAIAYNDLSRSDALTADGGEIYICCLDGTGNSIDHNWLHNSLSARIVAANAPDVGIYIDEGGENFLIHHNLAWGNHGGLLFNGGPSANGGTQTSFGNLVYNNTIGINNGLSLQIYAADCTGSKYINNIYENSVAACANSAAANNLPSSTNPSIVNRSLNDYHLKTGSPAIDAGQVIPGITDGYVGNAPDEGAYEYKGAEWTPGCSFVGCRFSGPTTASRYTQASSGIANYYHFIGGLSTGQSVSYAAVDFGSGVTRFTARVAVDAAHAGNFLDLHLDSATGPLVGTLTVQSTGSYGTTNYQSTAVTGASGVHDLYIVPRGGYNVANLVSFQFTRDATKSINAASQLDGESGVYNFSTYLGNLNDGNWLRYGVIDFGTGVTQFTASVAVDLAHAGHNLELHLDSMTGPLVGTLTVQSTGGFTTFTSQSTTVSGASGVHDLYIVARGGATVANVASFQFA